MLKVNYLNTKQPKKRFNVSLNGSNGECVNQISVRI